MKNFETFLASYIAAMLWSSTGTDQNGEELESLEGFELSTEAYRHAREDCELFLIAGKYLMAELPDFYGACVKGGAYAYAGHDFWLTRNGHGAGFWDRGLEDIGDRLTELSKTFGELDPYIGDDGKIYF